MASTPQHGLAQILPTDDETPYSTPKFRPNSHRNPSFSSSSRSSSSNSSESSPFFFNNSSPPPSPTTPLNLKGVPFSWEQTPGIPKNRHGFKKTETSNGHRLPLPPAGSATSAAAKKQPTRFKRDPFFAAMLECSKDGHDHDQDHDHGTNFWKGNNLSDRLGLINMYSSCKKTCAISESIVYVPRGGGGSHYLRRGPAMKP